jgi:hypothetical protein
MQRRSPDTHRSSSRHIGLKIQHSSCANRLSGLFAREADTCTHGLDVPVLSNTPTPTYSDNTFYLYETQVTASCR